METRTIQNTFTIKLTKNFEQIREFCHLCCSKPFEIDVASGRHKIDGKSLLGLYSLNMVQPVQVIAQTDDEEELEIFRKELEKYQVG